MTPLELIVTVVLTTASGALAPGPMFTANVIYGAKYGARSGLSFSIGHTLVELPLILLLGVGLLGVAAQRYVASWTGAVGGGALIVFGVYQLRSSLSLSGVKPDSNGSLRRSSVAAGVFFTALNPFFILWWLSVGARLVLDALLFASLTGLAILFASHIWMDYVWLTLVTYLARRGRSVLDTRGYRVLLAVFSIILMYFGYVFLSSAAMFFTIPLSSE